MNYTKLNSFQKKKIIQSLIHGKKILQFVTEHNPSGREQAKA